MASGSFNDSNSQLNDSIDTISSKILSNEQEKSLKNSQMATKKLSNSIDVKPHLEDFDETQLKSLLDEALDYKSPRDANDKSDTFKQLLKNVTEEDMKHNERFNLGNYGMKQSNSLQNLFDDSHYQLNSHQSHTSSKKHHQRRKNSTSVSTRRLEGGSLPIDMHHSSAIQSPPDQPFLSEYKNKQKRKEKQQQKETVIDIGEDETDDRKLMQRHFDSSKDYISSSYPHDGIEMKSISYTNTVDLQVQDVSKYSSNPTSITTISSMTAAGGPPLATASIINPKVTTSTVTSSAIHNVDKIIEFPSLVEKAKSYQPQHQIIDVCSGSTINHNNNIVLANPGLNFDASSGGNGKLGAALQLNSSYNAVASLTSTDRLASSKAYLNKHENTSAQTLIQTAPMIAAAHNSGVVVNSKEAKSKMKRTPKTNETTVDVKSIQGFRGTDEIEDLLKYIEDGGGKNQRSHPKNGIVSSNQASDHLLSAEDKKKKIAAKNNKVNKLKKSNSMDELCSTGRQQQQQQEKSSSSSSTAANKIIQDQKRNERRSWGTEGLWSEAGVQVESTPSHDNQQQDEGQENESSSSSSSSGVQSDNLTLTDTTLTFVNNAEPANAVVSETEFHVVTKKRKVKRKSTDNVDLVKTSNNLQSYNMKRDSNARPGSSKPYNDRTDVGSKNVRNSKPLNQDAKASTGKNRRKSTSSMPPSDDECSSDGGDSVQSLPIETTKTTSSQLLSTTIVASADHNNPSSTNNKSNKKNSNHPSSNHHQQQQQQQQQQKPATFSYADIAKTNATRNSGNNVTTSSTEKWPSISASTTSSSTSTSTTSHQNNNNNVIINDPFSIANFDAVVSNSLSNHHQQKSQQKSAPIITTNMMSFPELVETNNNKNKQLSSNQQPPSSSSSSSLENNSSGDNN
ncbi:CLUMA_CG005202, isoform B [Clunio marinus]|nr:CLUMA_CG005202, isoform B [Clunio marinus]